MSLALLIQSSHEAACSRLAAPMLHPRPQGHGGIWFIRSPALPDVSSLHNWSSDSEAIPNMSLLAIWEATVPAGVKCPVLCSPTLDNIRLLSMLDSRSGANIYFRLCGKPWSHGAESK